MDCRVLLMVEDGCDVLRFVLDEDYDINLNSDDQTQIKKLFYKLISIAMNEDVNFLLNSDNHEKDIFYDIAVDYLKKLQSELGDIRTQIPSDLNDN